MTAPKHLSDSAKAAWESIVADIDIVVEAPALEAYAVALGRMRDAQARIDAEGLVVADDKGRPAPHPALAIEKQQADEVRKWLQRYRPRPARRGDLDRHDRHA